MTDFPIADTAAAKSLGFALRSVGYSEDAIHELLDEDAYSRGEATRRPTSGGCRIRPLATADPHPLPATHGSRVEDAVRALGRDGVDALETTGLARVGDEVVPRARILPVGKLLVAATATRRTTTLPTTSRSTRRPPACCDSLTPRPRVDRCARRRHRQRRPRPAGGLARAPRHRDRRERTRARVHPAQRSAQRAHEHRVPARQPVRARRRRDVRPDHLQRAVRRLARAPLGLPRRRLPGGRGVRAAVRDAAAHLADGGFATLLVSWLAQDEDEPDERALVWAEQTGCDSWILSALELGPARTRERMELPSRARSGGVRRGARRVDGLLRGARRSLGSEGGDPPSQATRAAARRGSTRSTRTTSMTRTSRSCARSRARTSRGARRAGRSAGAARLPRDGASGWSRSSSRSTGVPRSSSRESSSQKGRTPPSTSSLACWTSSPRSTGARRSPP